MENNENKDKNDVMLTQKHYELLAQFIACCGVTADIKTRSYIKMCDILNSILIKNNPKFNVKNFASLVLDYLDELEKKEGI
jgi:hypothetical protein